MTDKAGFGLQEGENNCQRSPMTHANGRLRSRISRLHIPVRWLVVGAVLLTVILAAIGSYAWQTGSRPEDLAGLGYPGIFLIMLVSGASIFFPAAAQATVMAAGTIWNPILVGLAAGLGNATGEFTGYLAGRAGEAVIRKRAHIRWWELLEKWIDRYGFFAILVLAMVPNPVFDAVGILAGSLGYSARRFWLACAIGNSAKYIGLAYLGDAAKWWVQ